MCEMHACHHVSLVRGRMLSNRGDEQWCCGVELSREAEDLCVECV